MNEEILDCNIELAHMLKRAAFGIGKIFFNPCCVFRCPAVKMFVLLNKAR